MRFVFTEMNVQRNTFFFPSWISFLVKALPQQQLSSDPGATSKLLVKQCLKTEEKSLTKENQLLKR